jgi:hypothetical protein
LKFGQRLLPFLNPVADLGVGNRAAVTLQTIRKSAVRVFDRESPRQGEVEKQPAGGFFDPAANIISLQGISV